MVFYFAYGDGFDTLPHSPDGSWTEGAEQGVASGASGMGTSWGYLPLALQGASGTVTVTQSADDGRGGIQFAIAPSGAAPPSAKMQGSLMMMGVGN